MPSCAATSTWPSFGDRRPATSRNTNRPPSISPPSRRTYPVRVSGLQPGKSLPSTSALQNPYEGNAQTVSEGQRLFEQYNCSGCHFHGGGGIGPALMDSDWIYGSSPANIYASITE